MWGLYALTGSTLAWYFGPFFVFVIIPIADLLAGIDPDNPPDEVIEALEEDRYYRWVTYAFIPVQIAGLIWGAFLLGGGTLPGIEDPLTVVQKIGLALGLGMVAGIGINTAHELGHKKEEYERWFARVALAQTFYGHFFIEHNRGHHVRVATPEDPASGRLGETVWEFMPRTMWGSLKSAWGLEKKRFARQKKSHWSIKNDLFNAWVFSVVLWGGLMIAFGLADPAVPRAPGPRRHLAARVGQLPRALRHEAPEARVRPLRAGQPEPQLEQQQHRHERAALSPAAPQRPSRQPHPPLPGAA